MNRKDKPMTPNKENIRKEIIQLLRMVEDPEIPMNIYDLGLIYTLDIDDNFSVSIDMTLTNPNCPVADQLMNDVHAAAMAATGVQSVNVNLVFEPEWSIDNIPDHIRLELGLL